MKFHSLWGNFLIEDYQRPGKYPPNKYKSPLYYQKLIGGRDCRRGVDLQPMKRFMALWGGGQLWKSHVIKILVQISETLQWPSLDSPSSCHHRRARNSECHGLPRRRSRTQNHLFCQRWKGSTFFHFWSENNMSSASPSVVLLPILISILLLPIIVIATVLTVK